MSKMQRAKGASWEREVARLFREAMPEADIRRNLQSQGGRATGNDLVVPGFAVECKVGKMPNPRAALAQAESDSKGGVPVAIIKDDRKNPFVVLRLSAFLEMVRKLGGKSCD